MKIILIPISIIILAFSVAYTGFNIGQNGRFKFTSTNTIGVSYILDTRDGSLYRCEEIARCKYIYTPNRPHNKIPQGTPWTRINAKPPIFKRIDPPKYTGKEPTN